MSSVLSTCIKGIHAAYFFMNSVKIQVLKMKKAKDLPAPQYSSPGSAGMDLRAAPEEEITLKPGDYRLIPTGLKIALPRELEGQVRPRSGLALNHGITVLNSPGTIDPDYRGEVKVLLINLGEKPYTVKRGDRIAQLVISRLIKAELIEVNELPETTRGEGGFGHSGVE